uniref:Uncharacterized protein n=1 Tax=Fundulus heteroclitus TaxID=8078 RepID=A0A3Q2NUD6_FUNHE
MSFAFIGSVMLLSSSVVVAFVLHPSNEEPAASANSPFSHQRCQDQSLQSIRKNLLRALNMQTEPQLPAGVIDGVREQWLRTFNIIPQIVKKTASKWNGNRTGLKCCAAASEISMKDLGWDSWVIYPLSLTVVQCALCNPAEGTVQCPASSSRVQDASSQVGDPCYGSRMTPENVD